MEKTNKIFKCILEIMKDVEAIGKNKKNAQQGFMYRGIDDLYNDLQPKFAHHGVFITSEVLDEKREERQSKSGGLLIYTILKIKFTFYSEDGSSVSSIMIGEAMDGADKSANKAMSVALKYCLMQLLLIPTEDVKKYDPDAEVHQVQAKAPELPVLTPEDKTKWTDAIKYLNGTGSILKIKEKYRLSEFNEELLKNAASNSI